MGYDAPLAVPKEFDASGPASPNTDGPRKCSSMLQGDTKNFVKTKLLVARLSLLPSANVLGDFLTTGSLWCKSAGCRLIAAETLCKDPRCTDPLCAAALSAQVRAMAWTTAPDMASRELCDTMLENPAERDMWRLTEFCLKELHVRIVPWY